MFVTVFSCDSFRKTQVALLWFKVTTEIHVNLALEQGHQDFRCKELLEHCVNFPHQVEHLHSQHCYMEDRSSPRYQTCEIFFPLESPTEGFESTPRLMSLSCHLQFHLPNAGTLQTISSEPLHPHQHLAVQYRVRLFFLFPFRKTWKSVRNWFHRHKIK